MGIATSLVCQTRKSTFVLKLEGLIFAVQVVLFKCKK